MRNQTLHAVPGAIRDVAGERRTIQPNGSGGGVKTAFLCFVTDRDHRPFHLSGYAYRPAIPHQRLLD
jgi:hypothetical protein